MRGVRLNICRRAAQAAALSSIAARIFLGLAVETPGLHNGAWLSALLGALPAALWLLCLEYVAGAGRGNAFRALISLFLLAVVLLDSSSVLSAITRSAACLALERESTVALALPACLAALWCAHKNGDALGYGAMLWARLFPAGLALVVLLQFRHYRPQWLTPVLGSGFSGVADGAMRTAGWIVPASAVLLVSSAPGARRPRPAWPLPLLASLVAALLLALLSMMTPMPIRGDSWINRLDALLTNGRAPIYLQLPMVLLWYAGLLHLYACECFAAASLLQRSVPRLGGHACAALCALASTTLSVAGAVGEVSGWSFIPVAVLTALATATVVSRKEDPACAR